MIKIYNEELNSFVDWCDRNHLVLTYIIISRTKEMVIDFRRQENYAEAIIITEKRRTSGNF